MEGQMVTASLAHGVNRRVVSFGGDRSPNPATCHTQQRQLDKRSYDMHPSRPTPGLVLVDEAADKRAEDGPEEGVEVYTAIGLGKERGR
ncbi:hypothetical protein FIBSPDRAFT_854238 [Athelia psychrophila]|uniref:Uncharacterized protein n=1 Tax=Athelia psychrophila TaxID=1759441 RepID=A0A166Q8Z5_9AGAM|nr:hypothetical protein FIBSPDRAFT_854238 [Fibularhizoctonia sp. CBS 109695]